jgi:hypothetical protein
MDRIKAKITSISIVRNCGFNDGGQITVQDGKGKVYYFYERSAWVEEYAKFNNINEERMLSKLVGRKVFITLDKDRQGNNVAWLSYPITKCTEDWHYKIISSFI